MNEITSENLAELNKRYRITVYLVLAQIFVVLFLFLASWLAGVRINAEFSDQDSMKLWVGVLFIAVGSFILRRMFFSWERLKNTALLNGIGGLLAVLQRNSVFLCFFGVVVGIIGFVIAALSGNSSDMLRAGAIAMIVFFINFPRKKIWKTIVSNIGKV